MDPSSALLHKLNGQLLECLEDTLKELPIEWDSKSWIINVIILNRSIEKIEEAEMRTSATRYLGRLFDEENKLAASKGVSELGGHVPLDRSLSGYCIRTGNLVWIDQMSWLEAADHPLRNFYRSFVYVGVLPKERQHPGAEYVFPIRIKVGTSEALLGVLNMEWFPEAKCPGQSQFHSSNQRDAITDAIIKLLDVHGPFLTISMLPEMAGSNATAHEGLKTAHREVLAKRLKEFCIERAESRRGIVYENV